MRSPDSGLLMMMGSFQRPARAHWLVARNVSATAKGLLYRFRAELRAVCFQGQDADREREAKAVDDVVSSLSRAAACLSVGLRIVNQMPRVRYRTAVRVLRSGCATFSYWWHTLSAANIRQTPVHASGSGSTAQDSRHGLSGRSPL